MKNAALFVAALGLLFTASAPQAHAQDLTDINDIVTRSNLASYYNADDGRADVKMKITDSQGRSRARQFTVIRKDVVDGGAQNFYIYFHAPADVAKMAFLVHKKIKREDDRWLYLPAMDLEKRISSADKRTSFAGSDFFYEDISGRSLSADTHVLVKTTDDYYVVDNTPKKPGKVEFSRFRMWIHKTTFLPMKAVFKDKSGKTSRIMSVQKVKTIGGYPTVVKATMEDKAAGSKTVVTYGRVKYDMGMTDKAFGKRSLRRPPMKFLR